MDAAVRQMLLGDDPLPKRVKKKRGFTDARERWADKGRLDELYFKRVALGLTGGRAFDLREDVIAGAHNLWLCVRGEMKWVELGDMALELSGHQTFKWLYGP